MKKWSKEHDEMLQMKKETKSALKVRGIMGTAESVTVCGKAGDWGPRETGFQGEMQGSRERLSYRGQRRGGGTSDL